MEFQHKYLQSIGKCCADIVPDDSSFPLVFSRSFVLYQYFSSPGRIAQGPVLIQFQAVDKKTDLWSFFVLDTRSVMIIIDFA